MKKIIASIALSFIALTTFAQQTISFGPKIGWNSNQLTTDYSQYVKDCKSGYQGGLFVGFYLKRFYIQPEAYFSVKHGALETALLDPIDSKKTSVSMDINVQSVDVPILLGYKVIDWKLLRLRVWGGPVLSYTIDKNFTLTNAETGALMNDRITKDDFKDANWSVQLGAGLDLFMLTFDVGYSYGLNDFLSIQSANDFQSQSNLFYCSIGWRLF